MPGQRLPARQRTDEERQPMYVVRAPDGTKRGRWVTVGYAWALRNGEGISIKLNSIPVGSWDGALVCLPPLQQDDERPPEDYDPGPRDEV
jgi:hypothetical protein